MAAGLRTAHADISSINTRASIRATAQVAISPGPGLPDPSPVRDDKSPADEFDVMTFDKTLMADATKEGITAKGRAQQHTTLTVSTGSLTFTSSASTETTATRTGDPLKDTFTGGAGSAFFSVSFTVDGRSTFSLGGSGSVNTTGTTDSSESEIELRGRGDDGVEIDFDFNAEDAPGLPNNVSASKSGALKPGSYTLTVFTIATIARTQSSSRSAFNCTFSVTSSPPLPKGEEEPTETNIRWTDHSGGSFSSTDNWSPHQVPIKTTTEADTAIFALSSNYPVDIGSAHTDRLIVSNGRVAFSNTSYTVDALALDAPSLQVTGHGTLSITGGFLNARHAVIGDSGSLGKVIVGTIEAHLQTSGRLAIGRGGFGLLEVSGGGTVIAAESVMGAGESGVAIVKGHQSEWQTGNLAVGFSSSATLNILDGGSVTSGEAFIALGVPPLIQIEALVDGVNATDGHSSKWAMTRLTIGQGGSGSLDIKNGGEVSAANSVQLGTRAAGSGFLTVSGRGGTPEHPSSLMAGINIVVGFGGFGSLEISSGGFVASTDKVDIGVSSRGDVTLRLGLIGASESRLTAQGEMHIGDGLGGQGSLMLEPFTNVVVATAKVGMAQGIGLVVVNGNPSAPEDTKFRVLSDLSVGGSGVGAIILVDGLLDVGGSINLNTNGTIQGRGKVRVAGQLNANGGTISPGLSPGTLIVDGDLVLSAASTLNGEIAGLIPGTEHDQLIVTGSATLDGKVILQFMNGFAPKSGDHINFLNVTGATTGDFAAMEVQGLAPGAQFQTARVGGAYTATAINDAVALPAISLKAVTKKAFEKSRRPVAFIVSRKGSTASPLVVNYTVAGSAENGVDYQLLPGSVTIPARKKAVTFKLQPFDDGFIEGDETVDVAVVPGADYSHSLKSKAQVTLINNKKFRP